MKPIDPFERPRYEAAFFPDLNGCTLYAVTEEDMTLLAGVGTPRPWTINQCRDYARNSGFTRESVQRQNNIAVFHWHKPVPKGFKGVLTADQYRRNDTAPNDFAEVFIRIDDTDQDFSAAPSLAEVWDVKAELTEEGKVRLTVAIDRERAATRDVDPSAAIYFR